MSTGRRSSAKTAMMKQQGTLNPHPERVTDDLFRDHAFFDPRDLVQSRYEMLRAVREDGRSVATAALRFGCSRPTYYKAQGDFEAGGMAGLVPRKRGPHGGHKLNDEVLDFIAQQVEANGSLPGAALAAQVLKRFGVRVHKNSLRRALSRREKRGG